MLIRIFIIFLLLWGPGCSTEDSEKSQETDQEAIAKISFDESKWKIKQGKDYPYREQMLDAVVYSDSIRTLHEEEIIALLGKPDRTNENYLYYMIAQTRLGVGRSIQNRW